MVRLPGNPIIQPGMDERIGSNINGPSLIRVPDWIEGALGRYYLYFADHKGDHIRLAYADSLGGPWTVHSAGSLHLAESLFPTAREQLDPEDELSRRLVETGWLIPHIASPDVHVDAERREIRMYYHGLLPNGQQRTRVALSHDGQQFKARSEILARSYLRVFPFAGVHYGLAMPGVLYRSADGISGFEEGPQLFPNDMRHAAVWRTDQELRVFWSRVGDTPEHILCSRIPLEGDWSGWSASDPKDVLLPDHPWEGADLPLAPSVRGYALERVRQLRDPGIFEESGRTYLLYSIAGESGIAIAELRVEPD